MADNLTATQRHRNMVVIHSANTSPELLFRRSLWKLGFRYRINDKRLPGSPDIVLPKYRTVVFVHGCFWHGHRGCKYFTVPKTNTEYWEVKVARNQERDQMVWRKLEAKGWHVIIVWECQLKKMYLDETTERVVAEILKNGEEQCQEQIARRTAREEYRKEQRDQIEKERTLMKEVVQKYT